MKFVATVVVATECAATTVVAPTAATAAKTMKKSNLTSLSITDYARLRAAPPVADISGALVNGNITSRFGGLIW